MIAVIALQEGQMSLMLEGCSPAQAAEMCEAAAQAIRDKIAAEGGPPAPPPAPPKPQLYLPTGGFMPPVPPINGAAR